MKVKQLNIRLPEATHRELKVKCVKDGLSLAEVIEELALAYLDGEIKVRKRTQAGTSTPKKRLVISS